MTSFTTKLSCKGEMPSPLLPLDVLKMANATRPEFVQKPYGKVVLTLKNCLLPEEKLAVTPSCADGLDFEYEIDLRILGCELIQTAGIFLRLPQVAMATGQVLFQRFFCSKSFIKHNMETVAMGCVCLASKIEEAPRRIRDVINVFNHIKQVRNNRQIQPLILDQNYVNIKNQVVKAERRVLKELGFCVHVKHPHKLIVTYLQVLESEKNQKLSQSAWNYMNDSLRTDIFLRYQPEAVACACIHLSARQLKVPLPNRPAWYLLFGVTDQEVDAISYTILKWCTRRKADSDLLEKVVDDIRKAQLEAKMKAKGIFENNTPQGTGFSPSSRQNTPKLDKSPVDGKKERSKDDVKVEHSPRNRETNHVKKRSRTPDSNKSGRTRSSRSNSTSVSPKRKARTPPRSYKDTRKSRSRSRSRSRSLLHEHVNSKDIKRTSNSSHKRRRSRSPTRSYSRSPHGRHTTSSGSGSKKSHHRHHHHHHHHKDSRSRYKSRSRSRERNHRDRSRSRSRSYDKYKISRKDRLATRDNGHHRSRSRDRSRR